MSFLCFCKVQHFFVKIHVWEREELDTSPLSVFFSTNLRCFEAFVVCFLEAKHILGLKDRINNQYHLLYHQVLFCFGLFGLFSYQCSKNQYRHPCSAYLFKVPESNPGVGAFLKLKSLMYQVKPCMSALKSKISETRL